MKEHTIIAKKELYQWIKEEHPDYSEASYRWEIYRLVHSGIITKIDNDLFVKGSMRKYKYAYTSPLQEQLIEFFKKEYPKLDAVMYDSTILNEWLNHQLARNIVFVEADKYFTEMIFEKMRLTFPSSVLVNPKVDEFTRYIEQNSIVVQNLATQAPRNKHSYEIKLEKLIVDLFTVPILRQLFSESEMVPMLESMFKEYVVEQKTMFAYAKRRKCDQKIRQFINQFTSIELR